MVQTWMIRLVIAFVVRQLVKFGEETDWAKLKADALTRIADLVPGTWFDTEAQGLAGAVVDAVATVLKDKTAIVTFVDLVQKGTATEALARLKDQLLSKWVPHTDHQKSFAELLANKPNLLAP